MKFYLESLGCARNLVDSEMMMGQLGEAGWQRTQDPAQAEVIIVNTCSFIESAADESIDAILELSRYKTSGVCQRLIVVGCLPERFREDIVPTLPEVDFFLGTGGYAKIVEAVENTVSVSKCLLPDPDSIQLQKSHAPRQLTTGHLAYLKIAEGCSRHCTYCIIPTLRGRQKSRPLEDIVAEAANLLASNVKELVLVAQDTTAYGRDLEPGVGLDQLLERLAELEDDVWIRFLYGHPESIQDRVFETVGRYPNICSYFDIPIQHASDPVLKKMGRHYGADDLYRLFDTIRSYVPDAALRTTVIVGFPGETERDFATLCDFVDSVGFDHLGVFTYSDSEDLPSHRLKGRVSQKVAQHRHNRLMSRQREISLENNQKYRHQVLNVLVEERPEANLFIGRTEFQAPEVDGITYIESDKMQIGRFATVKITDVLEYDLIGEPI